MPPRSLKAPGRIKTRGRVKARGRVKTRRRVKLGGLVKAGKFSLKNFQGVRVKTFRNPAVADEAQATFFKKLSLKSSDTSYQERLVPHLKTLNSRSVRKVYKLVDKFLDTDMIEKRFKSRWRSLARGTDEHVSTQTMFVFMHSIKSGPQKNDRTVVKGISAAASSLRLPTGMTGHSFRGHELKHPAAEGASHHVALKTNPNHAIFDLYRRTSSTLQGEETYSKDPQDGTGAMIDMIIDASTLTNRLVSDPFAKCNKTLPHVTPQEEEETHALREGNKDEILSLSGKVAKKRQSRSAVQFLGKSPADSALVKTRKRMRTGSLSPPRSLP